MSGPTTGSAETLAEALDYLVGMANGHDYADALKIMEARDVIEDALSTTERHDAEVRAERNEGLADYLARMDRAGGGIYTSDFRQGFRHALAMLAAYESDEETSPDRVRPEVREAARLALSRRAALAEEGDRG